MKPRWNGFHSPLANGIQQFLAHKRALGQNFHTEEKALRLLDAFLVQQKVGNLEEVTVDLIDAFVASRPRTRPRSYNHLISVLRRLFRWLVINSYLTSFPWQPPTRRDRSPRIPFLFTPDQARLLLASAARLKTTPFSPSGSTYRTCYAAVWVGSGDEVSVCVKDGFRPLVAGHSQIKFAKVASSRLARASKNCSENISSSGPRNTGHHWPTVLCLPLVVAVRSTPVRSAKPFITSFPNWVYTSCQEDRHLACTT
jgi:hypothetical protein